MKLEFLVSPCYIVAQGLYPHSEKAPRSMEPLVLVREWLTTDMCNRAKLRSSLCTSQLLLSNIFDSHSGRHWVVWCSVTHAVPTDRFAEVSAFFVPRASTSEFVSASSLPPSLLKALNKDLSAASRLFRELVSFDVFKQFEAPALLLALLVPAAEICSPCCAWLKTFVRPPSNFQACRRTIHLHRRRLRLMTNLPS